jgi:CHAT domain-containing protein
MTIEQLRRAVEDAEERLHARDYVQAFELYAAILLERVGADVDVTRLVDADMTIFSRLAELATLHGEFVLAESLLLGSAALYRDADVRAQQSAVPHRDVRARHCAAFCVLRAAGLALDCGDAGKARRLLEQWRGIVADIDTLSLSIDDLSTWERSVDFTQSDDGMHAVVAIQTYYVIGRVLAGNGHYGTALKLYTRALEHATPETAVPLARAHEATLQLARCEVWLETGKLSDAATFLDEPPWLAGIATNPQERVRANELRGRVAWLRGDYGTAIRNFEDNAQFCADAGFLTAAASARIDLAQFYAASGRDGAAQHLLRGLIDDPGAAPRHRRRAQMITTLIAADRWVAPEAVSFGLWNREMLGAPRSASPLPLYETPDLLVSSPMEAPLTSYYDEFSKCMLEFRWKLALEPQQAQQHYDLIHKAFHRSESPLIALELHVLRAQLLFARHDFAAAEQLLRKIDPELQRLELVPQRLQVLHLRARCLVERDRDAAALALSKTADTLLHTLADSLGAEYRSTFLLRHAALRETFLIAQVTRLSHDERRLAEAGPLRRLWYRWRFANRFDRLLGYVDAFRQSLATTVSTDAAARPRPSARRARSSLWRRFVFVPRDQLNVSILVFPDRTFIGWSRFLHFGFTIVQQGRADVRQAVQRWYDALRAFEPALGRHKQDTPAVTRRHADPATLERQLDDLAQQLGIAAVLTPQIGDVTRLRIVPDDLLHAVPFAAVPVAGKRLIEHCATVIGFSSRARPRSVRRRSRRAVIASVSCGAPGIPALAQVAREAVDVAAWIRRRKLELQHFADHGVDRASLLRHLPGAVLAHFACHGTSNPQRPDQSGLILLPREREDLTLRDLAALDLRSCRLACLSACWSADIVAMPGHGVLGLPETLWRSGAERVLGALWPVDDGFAADFIATFYAGLDRMSPEDSLRNAQRAFATRPIHDWSAFRLCGESGPSRL